MFPIKRPVRADRVAVSLLLDMLEPMPYVTCAALRPISSCAVQPLLSRDPCRKTRP